MSLKLLQLFIDLFNLVPLFQSFSKCAFNTVSWGGVLQPNEYAVRV